MRRQAKPATWRYWTILWGSYLISCVAIRRWATERGLVPENIWLALVLFIVLAAMQLIISAGFATRVTGEKPTEYY